jgi:Coenzyme PQQ synthesis protein D (PqqD)
MMIFSFDDRIKLPDDVLISGLQAESVLLNLDSERYYGLNDVGTRMLTLLTSSDSIGGAYNTLLDEFDVEAEVLRRDLISTIEELAKHGLVEIVGGSPA